MPNSLAWTASLLLALTFAWAGVAKILGFRRWEAAVRGYSLPTAFVSVAVPIAELAIVGILIVGPLRIGGAISVAVLAGFSFAVLRARRARGDRVPCGCFGGAKSRDYRTMLARNAILGVLAAFALFSTTDGGLVAKSDPPEPGELVPLALAVLGLTLALWLLWTARSSFKERQQS